MGPRVSASCVSISERAVMAVMAACFVAASMGSGVGSLGTGAVLGTKGAGGRVGVGSGVGVAAGWGAADGCVASGAAAPPAAATETEVTEVGLSFEAIEPAIEGAADILEDVWESKLGLERADSMGGGANPPGAGLAGSSAIA